MEKGKRLQIRNSAGMIAYDSKKGNFTYERFVIPGRQVYTGQSYQIEGDASSATYFFFLSALLGQEMRVPNVPAASAQGDVRFLDVLERMGCRVARDRELSVQGPAQLKLF